MFTGIVRARGRITGRVSRGGDWRYRIDCGTLETAGLPPGASLAVNGVCLTVVERTGREVAVDVSQETLRCTTFADLAPGCAVNLEPALAVGDALGGHFVSGHVDGVGTVTAIAPAGRSRELTIALPAALARYVAPKGSICVDGVSLTVNEVQDTAFSVNIIPHTLEVTVIGEYAVGRRVNLEVDLLARYLERLLVVGPCQTREAGEGGDPVVDRALLRNYGFEQGFEQEG